MMLPLRIRKAEVAMADGRLEDAYEQAIRTDVRDHRRGQRLIGRLTRAYEQRVQDHLKVGNARAALTDADRAVRLGGNQPAIVALQDEARSLLAADQNAQQVRHQKLAAAKRCMATGDFSLGAKICREVDEHAHTVVGLMRDAELQRRLVDTSLERGRKALKAGRWEVALEALEETRQMQPVHAGVTEFAAEVADEVVQQIRHAITQGRLDHAEILVGRIRRHAGQSLELQEIHRFLSQCHEVAVATQAGQWTVVAERLKSLQRMVPDARWLEVAIAEAEVVARNVESLKIGPLGNLLPSSRQAPATVTSRSLETEPPMRVFEATPVVPDTFQIHLDGAGSFLVVRADRVSMGPQSRSRPVDVPLVGQMGVPAMTIERLDEDYFLSSDSPVSVNGKRTANTLLHHQTQVKLGRRGTLHFAQPNAASTTATLDFIGLRPTQGKVRRVILMDDAIVIGPQPSAHIQSLSLERAMVLHLRHGEMRMRPLSRSSETPTATLTLDQPHELDGLSLVVTRPGSAR